MLPKSRDGRVSGLVRIGTWVSGMFFLPAWMNLLRSSECSACPTVALTWVNCLTVASIWLSRILRSVMMMIESNASVSSRFSPTRSCASQAIEIDFPLPAEC